MTISHFGAVLLCALFTSVVFGITQRAEPRMMIRFGAFCFVLFVGPSRKRGKFDNLLDLRIPGSR